METIKELIAQRFSLFNVGIDKRPVTKEGHNMFGWQSKTYNELIIEHNYNSKLWGISLGKQENGRHILSLDFDIYDKDTGGKEMTSEEITEMVRKSIDVDFLGYVVAYEKLSGQTL